MKNRLHYLEKNPLNQSVHVIGVPTDAGKVGDGTAAAPDYLRRYGLLERMQHAGLQVEDRGNVAREMRLNNMADMVVLGDEIAGRTAGAIHAGAVPLVLGGDNSISMGTVGGIAAAFSGKLGLIWIDAHGDFHTAESSLTENIHGMPAAALLGFGEKKLVDIGAPGAAIDPAHALFLGLKDLDPAEVQRFQQQAIDVSTMADIVCDGLGRVEQQIIVLSGRVDAVCVCFDVDVLDIADAPASLLTTKGGLTHREITIIATMIGKHCQIAGIEISEFVPALDKENKTAEIICEFVPLLCGTRWSGYEAYMLQSSVQEHTSLSTKELALK